MNSGPGLLLRGSRRFQRCLGSLFVFAFGVVFRLTGFLLFAAGFFFGILAGFAASSLTVQPVRTAGRIARGAVRRSGSHAPGVRSCRPGSKAHGRLRRFGIRSGRAGAGHRRTANIGEARHQNRPKATRAYSEFWQGAGADRAQLVRYLPSLLDTADELKTVAARVGAPANDIHLEKDASETTVKRSPLANYCIVYFATHGLVAGDIEGLGEPSLVLTNTIPAEARATRLISGRRNDPHRDSCACK
jgi:hypothetical protein